MPLVAVNRIGPARCLRPFFQLRDPPPQFLRLGFDRLPQLPVLLCQRRRLIPRGLSGTLSRAVHGNNAELIITGIPGIPEFLQHLAHSPGHQPGLLAPGHGPVVHPQGLGSDNPAPAINQGVQQVQ